MSLANNKTQKSNKLIQAVNSSIIVKFVVGIKNLNSVLTYLIINIFPSAFQIKQMIVSNILSYKYQIGIDHWSILL